MRRLSDTSPEAQRVLDDILRALPFPRRWRHLGELYAMGRSLHAAGLKNRGVAHTPRAARDDWIRTHFKIEPDSLPAEARAMTEPGEFIRAVEFVTEVLDRLRIPYALGGSIASSLYGVARLTYDADLTVDPFPGREAEFLAAFGTDFYGSLTAVRDALSRRGGFNLIQTTTGFKADFFVRGDRPFELSLMRRRTRRHPSPDSPKEIQVVSPEDIVLLKLRWYRLGGEISDRQWSDVLGVLRVQQGRLDEPYLDHWSADLGVADLLKRARAERDESGPPGVA